MLLRHHDSGHLVEVLELTALTNPFSEYVQGRFLWGEELPDPEPFIKLDLEFPSGEQLPHCWWDPHYQNAQLGHRRPPEQTPGYYGA